MSIKVVIANNNDILHNRLSVLALKNELKIEIINIPIDKLNSFICHLKAKQTLIVLDSATSISFCCNIIKNAIYRTDKQNIIILVINSRNLTNSLIHNKHIELFNRHIEFSLFDAINLITDSIKETLNIEKTIDDIFWKLGFTPHFKGTIYLKDAIMFAYNDRNLLQDMDEFVKRISEKNNVINEKSVRSVMDKSLNTMLEYTDISVIYNVFKDDYDGRKISLKYFIDLCIRYLEKIYSCLEY